MSGERPSRGWLLRSLAPGAGRNPLPWILAMLLGVAAGLGAYTFSYAKGLSYFGTDPRACTNCHIMEPEYAGWQKGSHHDVAVCIDCHLPHSFLSKYLTKPVKVDELTDTLEELLVDRADTPRSPEQASTVPARMKST